MTERLIALHAQLVLLRKSASDRLERLTEKGHVAEVVEREIALIDAQIAEIDAKLQ